MWRNWNPHILLMGTQNGAAIVEDSLMFPPKVRHKVTTVISHSVLSDFFATAWTVAHQALLSLGFSRQEYWSE